MGVRVINLGKGDAVLAIARNADPGEPEEHEDENGSEASHSADPSDVDGASSSSAAETSAASEDGNNAGLDETGEASNGSLAE
jgi:DNA gyrase subunit A